MKSYIVFVFIFIAALNLSGQDTLIIGHPTMGGSPVYSFNEVLLASDTQLQLDGINGNDVFFNFEYFHNQYQSHASIKVDALGSFEIFLDTNSFGKHKTNGVNSIVPSSKWDGTQLRKLNLGDTITTQDTTGFDWYYLYNRSSTGLSVYLLDSFLYDTSYIALIKRESGVETLFVLKVYQSKTNQVRIIEVLSSDVLLATNEVDLAETINVYPNPCMDIINIPPGVDEVEIYSLVGRMMHFQSTAGSTQELDISFLQQGMYILKLRGDNINGSVKILKQ